MSAKILPADWSRSSLVVGVVDSPAALRQAIALSRASVDLIELRADAIADARGIEPLLPRLKHPMILTVRHHAEGGAVAMPASERRRIFARLMPHAAMIDVEIRSLSSMAPVVAAARNERLPIIGSFHDFRSTPSLPRLQQIVRNAREAEVDLLKIAALTETPLDICRLLQVFRLPSRPQLSLMGMGRFGMVSRLLFAQAGSVLNYGYLAKPQVSGQWPAALLKQRLKELAGS